MIERGLIPSRRLGRRVIVLAAELEAYLASLPQPAQEVQNLIESAEGYSQLQPTEGRPDEVK
jgi:hypothetical protein